MTKVFQTNETVNTPKGKGTIVYVRMLGPDYREPACYSVMLESKLKESQNPPFPFYNGTIFPADQVTPIE